VSEDVRTSEELAEATTSGLRWITAARIFTEILLLGTMVLLARLIPPSAFGMFAIALLVQELAISISSEGVGTALVQRRRIGREHLEGGMAVALAIAGGFAVLTLAASYLLVRPIFGEGTAILVALATPWFLISAIGAPSYSLLRRRLDFRRVSILDLTNSFVRASLSLALALIGLDAGALVLGALAGVTTATVLSLMFAPVPLPRWRSQAIRDLLSYGGPAALASVCWAGFRNGDYAIVGAKLGAAQAGLYWRGFQLAVDYQRKISAVMTSVGFPVLARTAGTEELYALRKRMVRMLTLVVFPLLASLVVLAPVAVPWIFGPAWEGAVLPTQILAGAGAATVVIDAVGTVLMATGRARAILGYGIAHFVVYVGAVLAGANWGLAGVSIAAVSTHLVFLVVAYQVLLSDPGWRPVKLLWDDVSAATVACVALVAAAWPLSSALGEAGAPAFVHLVVVGAVSAVPYLTVLRLWFPDAWRDLSALIRRVLPARPLQAAVRRLPLPAGRSS
jgi:O-antigen/teichoic acid export membrane protein